MHSALYETAVEMQKAMPILPAPKRGSRKPRGKAGTKRAPWTRGWFWKEEQLAVWRLGPVHRADLCRTGKSKRTKCLLLPCSCGVISSSCPSMMLIVRVLNAAQVVLFSSDVLILFLGLLSDLKINWHFWIKIP